MPEKDDPVKRILGWLDYFNSWNNVARISAKWSLIIFLLVQSVIICLMLVFGDFVEKIIDGRNITQLTTVLLQFFGIIVAIVFSFGFASLKLLSEKEREYRMLVWEYSIKLSEILNRKDYSEEFKKEISERIHKMVVSQEYWYKDPIFYKIHLSNSLQILSVLTFLSISCGILIFLLNDFASKFFFFKLLLSFLTGGLMLFPNELLIIRRYY